MPKDHLQNAIERQKEIYLNGAAGFKPSVPVDMAILEKEAAKKMSTEAAAYIIGGAGTESTISENRQAFGRWKIVPRMLRDVSERNTSIELFGRKLPYPLLLSPVGVLEMVHKEADIAVAKAAAETGTPYIFSNQASRPMEDCAQVMGDSSRWFQLYWSKSDELVTSFVQRAEKAGCEAITVTLDTTLLGWRMQDLNLAYLPFLRGKGIAQYISDPVFNQLIEEPPAGPPPERKITLSSISMLMELVRSYPGSFFKNLRSGKPLASVRKFIEIYSRPSLTWENLSLLREVTKLPILLKGVLHPDDAKKALDVGIDGLIVSNHGGRQVDGSISSFDALPGIAEVIDGHIPIIMDSGIRSGSDIFKAIALGATAVCIGRPYVYGLTLAGQQGVKEVINNITADFELTMGLAGCKDIREIHKDQLVRI